MNTTVQFSLVLQQYNTYNIYYNIKNNYYYSL